ncbi:SLBB domain-containing protein [Aquabacterium sp. J223]|uniref:SLBB domain-containing protein n=1 Tax=Aquabacterium sp. J223 TaxID=2898431 RepID=UPI0021ADDF23|nr:SLBB domain-containing protein [Aquabacterium sp. J223]UUX96781.1 SLBB domain-containing protein [Aquabacterium sp. J223]
MTLMPRRFGRFRFLLQPVPAARALAAALALGLPLLAGAQTTNPLVGNYLGIAGADGSGTDAQGPVRLRRDAQTTGTAGGTRNDVDAATEDLLRSPMPRYVPGEFERFVNRLAASIEDPREAEERERSRDRDRDREQQQRNVATVNRDGTTTTTTQNTERWDRGGRPSDADFRDASSLLVRRLGADLMSGSPLSRATDTTAQVPSDYLISPGDEVVVTLWGSVDADLRLTVDRGGRISIPRVGAIMVAGVRYADLRDVITQRVGQVFRNFQVSVGLGQLRSIRIYVTGFTARPGSYTVSSLSTVVNGLMRAGGPSAAGSFRDIELRRNGQLVSRLDLYDLLLKGDKAADRVLQAEDVIHINPVGPEVGLIGSVNRPAIFELKPGETVADVLRMAGGFTAVADRSRLTIERLDRREDQRIDQLNLPADIAQAPAGGDVLRAFSAVQVALPVLRQNKRVRVEGEVMRPGEYILPAGSTIADAVRRAGGLTSAAYVFGTEFNRESVRLAQQANYERALRDLETEITRNTTTQRSTSADEAAALTGRLAATSQLIQRLRAVRPSGRVVLQLQPTSRDLPDLPLEEGDRLYVPPAPTSIGVFGSVYNAGSFLFARNASLGDYLNQAGGPTRGADANSTFVLRANGAVVSSRQRSGGWFGIGGGVEGLTAEPGDTVFVPEQLNKSTFVQNARDWTAILYQFGLGAAALQTIRNN